MNRWGIDELARRAGLPVGTVRLYLRDGLVPSGRRAGRSMTYGVLHLNRLIRIRQLKAANFTLTAIKRMIDDGQFVMLDRVFGTDLRPRSRLELAEEVGVEPGLLGMLEDLGLLADPADRGVDHYDGGEASVVEAVAQLIEMGTPPEVLSVVLPLYVRHMQGLERDLVSALSGTDGSGEALSAEVVTSYARRTAQHHEAFLFRWDVVVDYLHHRMIQRLVHRASAVVGDAGPP
jgi:DNA-binding transcriptional MerR regulator